MVGGNVHTHGTGDSASLALPPFLRSLDNNNDNLLVGTEIVIAPARLLVGNRQVGEGGAIGGW